MSLAKEAGDRVTVMIATAMLNLTERLVWQPMEGPEEGDAEEWDPRGANIALIPTTMTIKT